MASPPCRAGAAQRVAPLLAALLLLAVATCGVSAQLPPHDGALPALRFAIYNQVHFHLEVVAGAMHVLRGLTSAPIDVFLPDKVIKGNWYGFSTWLGSREGFVWHDYKSYAGNETYDMVWFISPEYAPASMAELAKQMAPKLALYYIHNGHIGDVEFNAIKALSGKTPLITLSAHVAKNISARAAPVEPTWLLPIYPFQPATVCALADLQVGWGGMLCCTRCVLAYQLYCYICDSPATSGAKTPHPGQQPPLHQHQYSQCTMTHPNDVIT